MEEGKIQGITGEKERGISERIQDIKESKGNVRYLEEKKNEKKTGDKEGDQMFLVIHE